VNARPHSERREDRERGRERQGDDQRYRQESWIVA
jgi:hypothetical protein